MVRDDEHASDDGQQGGNREALKHENSHGLKRCEDKHREHEHDGQQREQPVRIHAPQSADLPDATHNPMHVDGRIALIASPSTAQRWRACNERPRREIKWRPTADSSHCPISTGSTHRSPMAWSIASPCMPRVRPWTASWTKTACTPSNGGRGRRVRGRLHPESGRMPAICLRTARYHEPALCPRVDVRSLATPVPPKSDPDARGPMPHQADAAQPQPKGRPARSEQPDGASVFSDNDLSRCRT